MSRYLLFAIVLVVAFAVMTPGADAQRKSGNCPRSRPGTVGLCVENCSSDYSCPGAQKCCSNGCGHSCKNPR